MCEEKCTHRAVFFWGFVVGCFLFLLVYGVRPLNVTCTDWLFHGDLGQHYLGWAYYRKTPWTFPIGIIQGLSDENPSIIYTDSIPIFAIIFKLLSPILPENFQYFGIWGVMSFALMGGLSALLLRHGTNNLWCCLIGSAVFVTSPYVLQRMYGHTALAGQWLIILAMVFWVYDIGRDRYFQKALGWTSILGLAAMVHPYFIVVVMLFLLGDTIRFFVRTSAFGKSAGIFLPPPAVVLCILTILGAFEGKSTYEDGGLGYYSANLNAFINPTFFVCKLGELLSMHNLQIPVCGNGQYEGMGYLGLGMIVLLLIDCIIIIRYRQDLRKILQQYKQEWILPILIGLAFFVLALSPTITLGNHVLAIISWPSIVIKILNIFRASGRFVWCVCYLLFFAVILIPLRFMPKKQASLLLTICIVLQFWDISPSLRRYNLSEPIEMSVSEEIWTDLLSTHDKVVYIPYDATRLNPDLAYQLAYLSIQKGLDTEFSAFNTARMNMELLEAKMQQYTQQITAGKAPAENLYVFSDDLDLEQLQGHLFLYYVDDVIVGASEPLAENLHN